MHPAKQLLKTILPRPVKDYWYSSHFKKRMYSPDGWEPHVYQRILKSIAKHNAHYHYQTASPYYFTDIGGFVGRYAYLIGREPNTIINSYEPIPSLYKTIRKKTRHMPYVHVHNYALGDTEEERTIYSYKFSPNLPDNMSSGNTFNQDFGQSYQPGQTAKKEYLIRIHTLDNMWHGPVNGMKIDTEGWEVQVLQGANRTIEKNRPDLFLEYHGNKTQLYNWLTVHDYTDLEPLDETDQFSYGLHGHMVAWA